ncbi:hypothetical protein KSS87_013159, partial [Heliosperma pusillum]
MGESKEFAGELYETLSRRRNVETTKGITIDQLRMFWEDMTSEDIDARLHIFFDMCDKNGDGKLSEDEVREVLVLSASANKLNKLKTQANNYAALIMEELDPDHQGYIELWQLESLLRGLMTSIDEGAQLKRSNTLTKTMIPKNMRNPISKAVSSTSDFMVENWKRIWVVVLWLTINAVLFAYKFNYYKHHQAFPIMGY